MIESIEHCGMLIDECPLPGETRADDVFPAHPNGIQVAQNRFLLLYATRGYRGTDDDLSIVAQLRKDAYDGPVIRDIMIAESINNWDPLDEGVPLVRQHGHPVAFGVPKGATVNGSLAPNANVFAIKWRVCARYVDSATGLMANRPGLKELTQSVEWAQVRLNEAEDDLDVLQPAAPMRQLGFEDGDAFCAADARHMNQSFTQPEPFSRDAMEWADVNHFDGGRIAALKYRFDADVGLYRWIEVGPLIGGDEDRSLSEASLVPCGDGWGISARRLSAQTIAWVRTEDPFSERPDLVCPPEPCNNAPLTAYACPDGVVRLITGDPSISPYRNGRDPLYLWDIDPGRQFAVSNRRVVFDCIKTGLGIPLEQVPRVDMAKLLPHAGGHTQILAHRVRSKATNDPAKTGKAITQAEKDASGIYYAKVHYREQLPGRWRFAG